MGNNITYNNITYNINISVDSSNAVLYTAREKEKPYTDDQKDPAVVQPYAAYSPAGQVKVKNHSYIDTDAEVKYCFKYYIF